MSDLDRRGFQFKVYLTRHELGQHVVEAALYQDLDPDYASDDETFMLEEMPGKTTQQVVEAFRECINNQLDNRINRSMLLIFDSADLLERGALLISLQEYHGFDDAVRLAASAASATICALQVGNDSWYMKRHYMPSNKSARAPVDWFALYDMLPDGDDNDDLFAQALADMELGVQLLGTDMEGEELDLGVRSNMYRRVRPDSRCSLPHVAMQHAVYAMQNCLDSDYFAVIDDQYTVEGVLIVRIDPVVESFRCKMPVAGEVLRWIFINFMTWEDAKDYAAAVS